MTTYDSHRYKALQGRVERVSQAVVRVDIRNKPDGFASVRQLLLDWLQSKAGRNLTDAMLRGKTDSLDQLGAQRVETVALDEPRLWAARQDDQDKVVPGRTWVTEATLASADPSTLLLGFRLHCVTSGDPVPFVRSVPRFMRAVAESHYVRLDHVETDPVSQQVETEDDTRELVRLLTDPRRRSPVIGIAMEDSRTGDRSVIDADLLAKAVFGTAHVRLLSRGESRCLTDTIGKRLSVFNGAVRIWWPNLQPDRDDPYDHPLWLADRIREEGDAAIRDLVTDRVLRASAARRDADKEIPSFAEARRAASTILREAAADSGGSANELLLLYEEENRRLIEERTDTKAEYDELLASLDENLTTVTADRDEARSEVRALRARLDEMMRVVRAREQKAEVQIPDSFDDLDAWAKSNLTNAVELLPRALKAAEKSDFENPSLAYQALLLLQEAYVPMRRGVPGAKERWESGLRQLGLEYSQTHAGTRAGESPDDYFVNYNGRRTEIDRHLKGSNSRDPRYCFRLYFFWIEDKMRVVVASLPSHLSTRVT